MNEAMPDDDLKLYEWLRSARHHYCCDPSFARHTFDIDRNRMIQELYFIDKSQSMYYSASLILSILH